MIIRHRVLLCAKMISDLFLKPHEKPEAAIDDFRFLVYSFKKVDHLDCVATL
jgi:hypothetical protein